MKEKEKMTGKKTNGYGGRRRLIERRKKKIRGKGN